MKTRLLGAAVLIALAVLFLPMIFNGKSPAPVGDQAVSLAIPPAPDRDLQTKTMSLNPNAPVAAAAATTAPAASSSAQPAAVAPGTAGQLATVNIGSTRPRDVETDPEAGKAPAPTTVTTGSSTSPGQPVIPMQNKPTASAPAAKPRPEAVASTPVPAQPQAATPAATGRGGYTLNLSAYASTAGATNLQRRVRALGYPVSGRTITQAGQPRTLVLAGPFETRAAAEAARLKITQSIPGVPARLEQQDVSPSHDEPASATASDSGSHAVARAGGWAVQLAAMSNQADANALRDKLRANGFDGFVDTVQSGGKQLWRVRAGPQTQRADALRLRDQIKARLGTDGNVVSVP